MYVEIFEEFSKIVVPSFIHLFILDGIYKFREVSTNRRVRRNCTSQSNRCL